MVIMGAMVKLIPGADKTKYLEAIQHTFKSKYEKKPELEALNAKAFELGYGLA
jgi:Pyruvate/2-oxoacid:ferredoxin oxidoreductase gamma subunit